MPLPDQYILDEEYDDIVDMLIAAGQGDDPHLPDDPQSAIRWLLGERLGVWPTSVLQDAEKAA